MAKLNLQHFLSGFFDD